MLTIQGTRLERTEVSRAIRRAFLDAGYAGIMGDLSLRDDHEIETVLFDPDAVVSMRRLWRQP